MDQVDVRVPVIVLTGFLGSGKTTLLNRILHENHGKRIAVVENEFGEVGVDMELVIGADEEIFEMNNGCICCTVRGDLIRILGDLVKRRERFDYVLIETTGLADPGPVAQTFFLDDGLRETFRLDGIVTVVDAKHVAQHLSDSHEAQEQIAFADVVLLNKIDLVPSSEAESLEARIHEMNAAAKIYRTKDAAIDLSNVLNIGGFNVNRVMDIDPRFMEPEYPFVWAGAYRLNRGRHELSMNPAIDCPYVDFAFVQLTSGDSTGLERAILPATMAFSNRSKARSPGGKAVGAGGYLNRLEIARDGGANRALAVKTEGTYALFLEHKASELGAVLKEGDRAIGPSFLLEFKKPHLHDDAVTSVGITTPGDLDLDRINIWLSAILLNKGSDIFRMKGVLSIQGKPERFVFQGVHMLFDCQPGKPWAEGERHNSLVFIGRNLNRAELNASFRACLA
jgi:G3E family GTPase